MTFALAPGHVDAPRAEEQRGGLLDALGHGPDGVDWRKGLHMWSEHRAGYRLAQPCSTSTQAHGDVDDPRPVAGAAFTIQVDVTGPNTGDNAGLDMLRGRAERMLRAETSQAVAREFWLGELTVQNPYTLPGGLDWINPTPSSGVFTNPFLTSGQGAFAADPESPMSAIGAVEARCSDLVAGNGVLIHLPLELLTEVAYALNQGPDGALYTAKGSRVIADSGYPGLSEPVGQTEALWVIGTGPVLAYWDAAVRTYERPEAAVDISNNEISVRAERDALYLFDPQTVAGCAVTP